MNTLDNKQIYTASGVTAACQDHLAAAKAALAKIEACPDPHNEENTLRPYNDIGKHLDAAGALASLVSAVHPDKAARTAAEACEQDVSRFATELSLNRKVYDAFAAVHLTSLEAVSQRFVNEVLLDFRRSGVDKDEPTREKIKKLNEELVEIGQAFDRNITEDVRFIELESVADLEGLPQDYIDDHKPAAGQKIRITTNYPDYIPFMSYAKSRQAREKLASVFKNRGYPRNESVFKLILFKRHELARALGYSHWADYVTEDKMIRTGKAVSGFIDQIANNSQARSDREYAKLLEFKKRDEPGAADVSDWERGYYEERVKLEEHAMDSKEIRSYFEFKNVKKGLLDLTSLLFGLRYEARTDIPVWHESVDCYDVVDAQAQSLLGRIYLDLHPREGKYKHAAQFTLRSGVEGQQLAEGVLVTNFPDPSKSNGPALMEHGDVVTFFHEFGHLLHHVLGGRQKWILFSGVATEWDFVEAPSQFFEEWAWDPRVLQGFAKHFQTGELLSSAMIERMRAAEEFGQGLQARHQMFYAALSLHCHDQDPATFAPLALLKEMQSRFSPFPYQEGTHFHLNFGHLNGYSAMYYTYMWSLVIAKDLLSPFKKSKEGLMDLELARQYRRTILEAGGSKDAADLIKDFLGRPYSFDSFKRWLDS